MTADTSDLSKRLRIASLLAAGLTLAVANAFLAGPTRYDVAIPGPLSDSHAFLGDGCIACHALTPTATAGIMQGVGASDMALEQAQRCQKCHPWGDRALMPHRWSDEELSHHAGAERAGLLADSQLACATCHREHRGRENQLADLSNKKCQSCHVDVLSGFDETHPAFASLGRANGGRIRFDHAAHFDRHFSESPASAPSSCSDCHSPEMGGERILTATFEQACANCHETEVRGMDQVDGPGLSILALPALDVLSLQDADLGVSEWPSDVELSETTLPPFLAFLLAESERAAADLQALAELDVFDLSDTDRKDLLPVARTVMRIRVLLRDLRSGGHNELRERIERSLGRPLSEDDASALVARFPLSEIERLVEVWFPIVAITGSCHAEPTEREEVEIAALKARLEVDFAESSNQDRRREDWVKYGGWYRRDLDFSLRYRTSGHADPFLRTWIDLLAEPVTPSAQPAADAFLAELTDPAGVGRCARCHTNTANAFWSRDESSDPSRDLTRFAHAPHFPALGETGCAKCHTPAHEGGMWGMAEITRSACVECHGPDAADSSCVTCHNYHARIEPLSPPHATPLETDGGK